MVSLLALSCVVVVLLNTSALASGQPGFIIPDSSKAYSGCPACDISFDSNVATELAANEAFGVVSDFVDALKTQQPKTVTDVFCESASLWGTVSQMARYINEEIYSYFDYFAREDNEILSACPQVLQLGGDLYETNVMVNNAGSCLRMSFKVDVKNR